VSVFGEEFVNFYVETMGTWSKDHLWAFISERVKTDVPHAKTWLDLCCGDGTLLRLILRSGYEGTGVDLSDAQIKRARRQVPKATILKADVCAVRLHRTFDVVTSTFSSLDYLTRKQDLRRAFRTARRHLADDGVFIFDISTVEGFRRVAGTRVLRRPGRLLISECSFDPKRQARRSVFTFLTKNRSGLYKEEREEHVQRAYPCREILDMLSTAGLRGLVLDGNDFKPVRRLSRRAIYICRVR